MGDLRLTKTQLELLATEAYGLGCATNDADDRAYAAAIEDLARYMVGGQPSERLSLLLHGMRVTEGARKRFGY